MGVINNGTTNKASNAAYISYYALSKQETLSGNKVLLALGGARSGSEELLLSAKDSLRESLVANSNSSRSKPKDMTKGQHLLAIQREIL